MQQSNKVALQTLSSSPRVTREREGPERERDPTGLAETPFPVKARLTQ